jgi:hypothetical protein
MLRSMKRQHTCTEDSDDAKPSGKDVRRHNDRNKKRRKRGRTSEILRQVSNLSMFILLGLSGTSAYSLICLQLEECLEPSKKKRSINCILADTVREIRRAASSHHADKKDEKVGNTSSSGSNTSEEEVAEDTEISGHSTMRDVLFACRDAGIAIVDQDLTILDCNQIFDNLLRGNDLMQEVNQLDTDGASLHGRTLQEYVHSDEEARYLQLGIQHLNTGEFFQPKSDTGTKAH